MADQDKDRLARAEDGAPEDPAPAGGTAAATDARAAGGDDAGRRSGAKADGGGTAPAKAPRPEDDPAADAGESAPGRNGASGEAGTALPPVPPGLQRPAGFAAGYAQPDPSASPGRPPGDEPPEGAGPAWLSHDPSASPYPPYAGYGPYPDQGYPAYGQPPVYGDPGYGDEAAYPYPPPPEYGEAPGYDPAGMYGEGFDYGQGPAYGQERPYGEGPGYGQYPEGPGYGDPPPGGGQAYGPEQRYGPARGYPAPPRPGAESQHHGPGAGQLPDPGQVIIGSDDAADRGAAVSRDQPPGPGPYPPQDPYRRQPTRYEGAPSGRRPGPYPPQDPYGQQARGAGDADEADQAYGGEAAYPPLRPAQDYRQPAPDETLTPLPAHGGDQPPVPETADDLTAEALLHGKRQVPGVGWRRVLYKSTGGLIHPRESAEAVRRRDLIARVRTPVAGGHHRVAVMSLKGGVGKTTTCVGLGAMLASLRGDRIIALDANPDRGTLSDKVRLETAATVRDLLNERDQIQRYADVRAFTSQAPSRLEVLASDRDPAVSVAFSEEDYYDAARVLEHYYSISLTDCGTGLLHSAMAGVLRMADQIVLVSSPSVDGARSASATLDWLEAHEYGDLVRNAVVVLSMIRPRSKSTVDLDRLEHHFASRCRSVIRIPYDAHLEEGAEVDLEQMGPATLNAYLVLAATVGDGLAWPRRVARQPGLGHGHQPRGGRPPGRRPGWSAPGAVG